MRRGLVGTIGIAGGLALSLSVAPFASAVAQESEVRVERAPRSLTVAGGGGAYLGIRIEDVDGNRAEEAGLSGEYGVYITSVVEEGPAAEAGLRDGDIIVRWNGDRLESVAQLQRRMGETPAGRTVALGVRREGSDREVSVELGSRSGSFGNARVFTVPRERMLLQRAETSAMRERMLEGLVRPTVSRLMMGRPRLGVGIQSLGDQLAEYFGVDGGALVTSVTEDSPAEAAGLQAGDVITRIGDQSVADPGELLEALSDLEAGPVEVTVIRDGSERSFTVELEESENRWGRAGDPSVRFFGREGQHVVVEPVSWEGYEVGPIKWDGFELDEMDFRFNVNGETIDFVIPRIEIPGFELPVIDVPAIEIPGFDFRAPRVEIVI
ncbi:MAG: PDZ domain-containing protein [Gemmatimonadota bacterium]